MALRIRTFIKMLALPATGVGLVSFGFGGKNLPAVDVMIDRIQIWLDNNADYPWLVVAGATILILWAGYQFVHWLFVDRKERWRQHLIQFLKDGVRLRNEGRNVQTLNEANMWISSAGQWRRDVRAEIEKFYIGEAEDFDLLDVVPPPRLPILSPITHHAQAYQQHDYRLAKLRDLVARYRQLD
jgi:hypothetical protein